MMLDRKRKMLEPMKTKQNKVSYIDNIYEEFLLIGSKVQKLP